MASVIEISSHMMCNTHKHILYTTIYHTVESV